jgi:osmoprotectant transport system substrate-binding protein
MVTRRTFVKGAAAAPLVGAAVARRPQGVGAQGDPVRIGSKDFAEQFILGEMYGLLLENAGVPIEVTTNLGGTAVAHAALINDEIDMYPEYPGTALETVLQIPFADFQAQFAATPAAGGTPEATPMADGTPAAGGSGLDAAVFQTVAAYYKQNFDVVLLDESAFNNTQALAVKRSFSEERGVTTISQLAEIAGELAISAPTDFAERADGLLGLQQVYGGGFADIEVLAVAPGLKYDQLINDTAEVVLAFSTDGEIAANDLVVLEDDQGLWPPYHCAPFVRQEALDAYPAIPDALNPVQPILTNEVMSGLNARVAIDGEEPVEVARAFLQENGLIAAQ